MAHANAALRIAPSEEKETTVDNSSSVVGAQPSAPTSMRRLPPPFPRSSEDPTGFAACLAQAIEKGEYRLARRLLAESATAIKDAGGNLDRLRVDVDLLGARTEHFDGRLTAQRAELNGLTGRVADQEKLSGQIIASGQRLNGDVVNLRKEFDAFRAELSEFRVQASTCAWGQHEAIARLNNIETIRQWDEEEKAAHRKTSRYIAVNGACAAAIGVVILAIIQQLGWLPAISRFFN